METIISVFRFTHIAGGTVALVAGIIPLIVGKGNAVHRRWGKIYMIAMGVVLLTALFISLFKSIPFLLLVCVFSSYLLMSGYRSLFTKKPPKPMALLDKLLAGCGIVGGCAMAGYGVYNIINGNSFGVVAVVFGAISILLTIADVRRLRARSLATPEWLYAHLSRMIGAYISTFTAFLVVNVRFLPGWLIWLLPTLAGTLLITYWRRKYEKKRMRGGSAIDTAAKV